MAGPSLPLTVFYNTRCPVCAAGINWQQNRLLQAVRSGAVVFEDINLQPDVLARFSIRVEDIRRRLHALDGNGDLLVGADVAVELWRLTPGQNWLATLFGNRLMRPLSHFGYNRFADLLYAWNCRRGNW
jgi:predicted DCC family thiol-disulfide oxidoreductase YuxK